MFVTFQKRMFWNKLVALLRRQRRNLQEGNQGAVNGRKDMKSYAEIMRVTQIIFLSNFLEAEEKQKDLCKFCIIYVVRRDTKSKI